MTAFYAEHGISRKTFYALRAPTRKEGQAAVLEPRSRRPKTSPTKITKDIKDQAVAVRTALEASGWDHGPITLHDKMLSIGLQPPAVASLARIFRQRDVARAQPNKKPRAAYRRFVYPAPNACWQLDATEYVLVGGRKGIAAAGVPQRLLTDNGTALNPERLDWVSHMVAYARTLVVEPITGRPDRPTAQAKTSDLSSCIFGPDSPDLESTSTGSR